MSEPLKVAAGIALTFDGQVYSVGAIKKAAYRFLDRFSVNISIENSKINCLLTFGSTNDSETCSRLVEDFKKEVLDQDLRETLKAETEDVRNLILAYAFSRTAMVSDEKIS
jgi:His-Xaa-Ser system protein HxsD